MKLQSALATAALLGVFSTSAFALTTAPAAGKDEGPVLTQVVQPAGLAQRHKDMTVRVTFTVDADGKARDIGLMNLSDEPLRESLAAAISQWKFTPGRKNGEAVPARVVLPIKLVEGARS